MAQNFFNRAVPMLTAVLWSIGLFQVLESDHLYAKLAIVLALPVVTGYMMGRFARGPQHQTVDISVPLK
ncbi:MAG TPA: hypothetical protein V6C81_14735 [Planktothrix sp.]|jgi:hypothetical protein